MERIQQIPRSRQPEYTDALLSRLVVTLQQRTMLLSRLRLLITCGHILRGEFFWHHDEKEVRGDDEPKAVCYEILRALRRSARRRWV